MITIKNCFELTIHDEKNWRRSKETNNWKIISNALWYWQISQYAVVGFKKRIGNDSAND